MDVIKNMLFTNWKTTLMGALLAAAQAVGAYLSNQPGAWPYVASVLIFLLGAFAKDHNISGTGSGPIIKTLVVGTLLTVLAAPAPARAQDAAGGPFGACSISGKFCYGPELSISLASVDLKKGAINASISPGLGYGVRFFANQPYQLGLAGYVNLQTGPEQSALLSGIVSFANYLRVGYGWQAIGGTHSNLILIGLGTSL